MEKQISDMLHIVKGSILDVSLWENEIIDTIVNAASPTLMGSTTGVDGAIHQQIDNLLGGEGCFNDAICKELKTKPGENIIRCGRGRAVTTEGHGLCNYVIHVVGSVYDGEANDLRVGECTKSCASTLESCYYSIIEELKKYSEIKTIGVPIVGAGTYGFPFKTAAEIAYASMGNALVDWKNQDVEMFELAGIKKVIFFVYDADAEKCEQNYQQMNEISKMFRPLFKKDKKVVCHNSIQSSMRYWNEIKRNDQKRGYFAIAKYLRMLLLLFRFVFMPTLWLKDIFGKRDWENRRRFVEWFATLKVLIPVVCWSISAVGGTVIDIVLTAIVIYFLCDTLTYLLMLIVMADVQNPSANLIRSMILMFVNYVEVAFDMAFLFHFTYTLKKIEINFLQAIAYGLWGELVRNEMLMCADYVFVGLNMGIKFFFVTLVFGYFMGHMKQRKFRS